MKLLKSLMRLLIAFSLTVILFFGGAAAFSASTPATVTLRAGAAAVKITPPLGIPLAGYYSARGAEGVADDLFAKALVLDDGKTKVALVVCDLIGVTRDVVVEARRLIEAQSGIPSANVMISATHTHTGPSLPRKSARDEIAGGTTPLSVTYAADLPKLIAQAVADASARLAPAAASYAREQESRLAYCRRFWMKDGTVKWNPGKLNPEIVRPVSANDPEVGVVYFEAPGKEPKPLATYVNYAIHTDNTGGNRISADLPGHLSRLLAGYRGAEMVTLFANGTCGNLNHLNVKWGRPQKGVEEAWRLATIMAGAVFKATMDMKPSADTTLRVRSELLQLPPFPATEQDLAQAREVIKRGAKASTPEQAQAYKIIDAWEHKDQPWEAEVQVITMGRDLAWVALPGEIFVELGLSIKAASPFAQTQIAELANGNLGYVPNLSAYPEGAYEVLSTRLAQGGGEKLAAAAIRMLGEMAGK